MNNKPLYVTRPFLPPLKEFEKLLKRIWDSRWLTNFGKIHQEFEEALCNYLGVSYVSLFTNGTVALMTALKALNLKGEVITTPFSSVATANSIVWNNLEPVFIDIEETTLNLDVLKVPPFINSNTSAILPVHVFGNPCQVEKFNELKSHHDLKLVYDAAHCFGVKLNNETICNFGDLAVLSFHATKVFNTFEGGAIISRDKYSKDYIDNLCNIGLATETELISCGLNGKMTEYQAAFGLLQLKYIDRIIELRRINYLKYIDFLSNIPGIKLIDKQQNVMYNYSYLPVLIDPEVFGSTREDLNNFLKNKNIICRRYFYPLISSHGQYSHFKRSDLPVAEKVSENILCLPLYHDISEAEINYVIESISECHRQKRTFKIR